MKKLLIIQTALIVGLVILVLSMRGCYKGQLTEKQSVVDSLSLANQTLQKTVNQRGQTITQQDVIITDHQAEIEDLTKSIFDLKKKQERQIKNVIAYYKGITATKLDSIPVPFVDTAVMKQWSDSVQKACSDVIAYYEANTITVPRNAKVETKDYAADFTVTQREVNINSLVVLDSQYLRFVTLKGGFMKRDQEGKRHLFLKRSVQVQVLHTSPYVLVTGGNSAIYKPKPKKNLVGKAILLGIGVFLGTKL